MGVKITEILYWLYMWKLCIEFKNSLVNLEIKNQATIKDDENSINHSFN